MWGRKAAGVFLWVLKEWEEPELQHPVIPWPSEGSGVHEVASPSQPLRRALSAVRQPLAAWMNSRLLWCLELTSPLWNQGRPFLYLSLKFVG